MNESEQITCKQHPTTTRCGPEEKHHGLRYAGCRSQRARPQGSAFQRNTTNGVGGQIIPVSN